MVGWHLALALVACWVVKVHASWPLPENLLHWGWLSSVVVGDYLYIDGGEYYTTNSASELTTTLAIDLKTAWTNLSISAYSNSRDPDMKTSRRPLLWYDATQKYVYEWAGWTYSGNGGNNEDWIWTFSPDGQGGSAWKQNPAPAIMGSSLVTTIGSSAAYTPTAFYSLGGTLVPDVVDGSQLPPNTTIQGLVSFSFSNNTWTNASSVAFRQSGFSMLGDAIFIPNFGQAGLLAFLGGDSPQNISYAYEDASALADMTMIPLYDIQAGAWYKQAATGDIPPGRTGLCAVGAPAADNSSFEIFVYGGFSNSSEESLNTAAADYTDVFVLSLPAFKWFRAAAGTRRAYHTCQLIGGRQMISIGGHQLNSDHRPDSAGSTPDPWTKGIGIFDMTALTWSSGYDPEAMPYEQSGIVKQYYQANPATPTFTDSALAKIFANASTKTSSTATNSPTAATKHDGGTNAGAIAGGVVGGIAGLCAILAIAWFLLRRQRRNRDQQQAAHDTSTETKYTPMGEMSVENEVMGEMSAENEMGPRRLHELGADPGKPSLDNRSELDASRP